jgi:hypothetical protein
MKVKAGPKEQEKGEKNPWTTVGREEDARRPSERSRSDLVRNYG